MLGVPLRAGAAHIMPLGPIAVARAVEQLLPPRHNQVDALEKRHGNLSVRLAEDECERENEDLVVEIVIDV